MVKDFRIKDSKIKDFQIKLTITLALKTKAFTIIKDSTQTPQIKHSQILQSMINSRWSKKC